MDKNIKRHLERRGVYRTRLPEEDTFTAEAPEFFRWFHETVMGFDSEEYRREFWREANRSGHTIGDMPYGLQDYMRRRTAGRSDPLGNLLIYCLWMGGSFAIWFMRRQIDRHLGRLRRPAYYEAERRRRMALSKERRRLRRRTTLSDCPAVEALREAFARRKDSPEAALRLGSMLEDLECYVDNSAIVAGGRVVGRRGGIRKWLHDNDSDLYRHYKRLMHYKALAKRFRQAAGVSDPTPAAVVLPPEGETPAKEAVAPGELKREFTSDEVLGWMGIAKGRARGILAEARKAGGSAMALAGVLAKALEPDYTPLQRGSPPEIQCGFSPQIQSGYQSPIQCGSPSGETDGSLRGADGLAREDDGLSRRDVDGLQDQTRSA